MALICILWYFINIGLCTIMVVSCDIVEVWVKIHREQGKCTCMCLFMFWPCDLLTKCVDPMHAHTGNERCQLAKLPVSIPGAAEETFKLWIIALIVFAVCLFFTATSIFCCPREFTYRASRKLNKVSQTKPVAKDPCNPNQWKLSSWPFTNINLALYGNGFGANFQPCKLPWPDFWEMRADTT